MGWKWDKAPTGVIWGDRAETAGAEEHGHDHPHTLVVHCDTQEDYDNLVALLEANAPE